MNTAIITAGGVGRNLSGEERPKQFPDLYAVEGILKEIKERGTP